MDAGQTVPFLGCAFDFTPPRQDDGGIPTMDMAIDNAAALLSEKLDAIVEASDPLEITYRQFFASDKTHPQYVLGGMMGQAASSNLSRVTITAGFADLYNKPYPPDKYSPDDYVTLAV